VTPACRLEHLRSAWGASEIPAGEARERSRAGEGMGATTTTRQKGTQVSRKRERRKRPSGRYVSMLLQGEKELHVADLTKRGVVYVPIVTSEKNVNPVSMVKM